MNITNLITKNINMLKTMMRNRSQPEKNGYMIIISHGCIDGRIDGRNNYVEVPSSVIHFSKKNVSACGFLTIIYLMMLHDPKFILNDVLEKGLDNSFPQLEDILRVRSEFDAHMKEYSLNHAETEEKNNKLFGPSECTRNKCTTYQNKRLINKIYSPLINEGIIRY